MKSRAPLIVLLLLLGAPQLCCAVALADEPSRGVGISKAAGEIASVPTKLAGTIRVCTFNLEDVRTDDLRDGTQPRLKALAAIIQRIAPDILFLNEIAYDMPGAPGWVAGSEPGRNAQRFADLYLAVPQEEGLKGIRYRAYMPPTNTGIPSGFDLDNDGAIVKTFPAPGPAKERGVASDQTPEGRAYGNDCFGFGTFPGQYAFALLVAEPLTIREQEIRTFQKFAWQASPQALGPVDPKTGDPWYDEAEWKAMRLSSKTHADIPVELAPGRVLHLLCSHPTPPAFDGPEGRNKRRNRDEIRFWRDYLDAGDVDDKGTVNARHAFLVDDAGRQGGLATSAGGREAFFVIVGDLNADTEPGKGSSLHDPMGTLLASPLLGISPAPVAKRPVPLLDVDDTAAFKLRVDYVLPSARLEALASGVVREYHDLSIHERRQRVEAWPSDHFPVWVDVRWPEAAAGGPAIPSKLPRPPKP